MRVLTGGSASEEVEERDGSRERILEAKNGVGEREGGATRRRDRGRGVEDEDGTR